MRVALMAVFAMLVAGCAAIEQSPDDIGKKLTEPTKGHFYERDPLQDH